MSFRRFVATFAALACLTCVSGCGSSDSGKSSSSEAPTTSVTEATQKSDTSDSNEKTAAPSDDASETPVGRPSKRGCAMATDEAVSDAWGATITKHIEGADEGCLWQVTVTTGVQVSFPPGLKDRLGMLKTAGSTDISIPGASEAFIRHVDVPGVPGLTHALAYAVFPDTAVQLAFGGPADLTANDKIVAVMKVVLGD